MSQPQPLNSLLNTLLDDSALTQDLSSREREAVKTFVEELMDGISEFSNAASAEADPLHAATDIDALISELGIELEDTVPEDNLVNDLLNEHSDATLIDLLSDHVDAASGVVEVLGVRPIGKLGLDTIRRVELQLVAVSLYVSDLRQTLERQLDGKRLSPPPHHWRNYVKSLLLQEFHFINNWLR